MPQKKFCRKRNNMLLSRSFIGPFCFWIWRVILILILTFCIINFFFIIAIIIKNRRHSGEPPGMVNAKIEEIINEKVYGVKPLYENKPKYQRNRILILSYSERSPIAGRISKDEKIFYTNINKKLRETQETNLLLGWGKHSRTAIIASLSIIR